MKKPFLLKPGSRVVILVQNLPVPFDRRVWLEATHLVKKGLDVHVICPSGEKYPVGKFNLDGAAIRRYKAPKEAESIGGYLREYLLSIVKMLWHIMAIRLSGAIQVIHYCNPPDLLFAAAIPFKIFSRTRLIFDQHDLGPELLDAKGLAKNPVLRKFSYLIERASYACADHVISTNQSYAEKALTRGKKVPSQVFIVRSGPKRDWAEDASASYVFRKSHEFQIGYIGVMGYQDGVDLLLRALQKVLFEYKLDVLLTLAGGGTELENLKELATELEIMNHVDFYGKVTDDQLLKNLIVSSDLCVATDRKSELNNLSTMNKIIEYMALSKPMILFDSKESRFSAGESAIYVSPDTVEEFALKIALALQDPGRLAIMGRLGRERFLRDLSWENQTRNLDLAYWMPDE